MTGKAVQKKRPLRQFIRATDANVTVEFCLMLPLVLSILFASFEAGYATFRLVVLERALDLAVRDLRIGALGPAPDHDIVRHRLCAELRVVENCEDNLMLEMRVIDRNSWAGLDTPASCADRISRITPVLDFIQGGSNEIVTIRACAVFDPFFPTTSMGLRLPLDRSGGYQLAAMSVFVNEPR